jgi:hypothetical protein
LQIKVTFYFQKRSGGVITKEYFVDNTYTIKFLLPKFLFPYEQLYVSASEEVQISIYGYFLTNDKRSILAKNTFFFKSLDVYNEDGFAIR